MSAVSLESRQNEAIVATGVTKWFGEGETMKIAVNGVGLVAHFGEMLFIVGPARGEGSVPQEPRIRQTSMGSLAF